MNPAYVVRQNSSWCLRVRIPIDLQNRICKKELRYRLKTGSIGEAKYLARRAAGRLQGSFRSLRKGDTLSMQLSEEQILDMIKRYIHKALEEELDLIDTKEPLDEGEYRQELETLELLAGNVKKALAHRDYKRAENFVDGLIEEDGIELQKDSQVYRRLCREMLKAQIKGLEISIQMRRGDYSFKDQRSLLALPLTKAEPISSPAFQYYRRRQDIPFIQTHFFKQAERKQRSSGTG